MNSGYCYCFHSKRNLYINIYLNDSFLKVIGSLFSFYIPMLIMVTTYILTVHHLKKQKPRRHVGISSLVAATVGATAYPGMGIAPLGAPPQSAGAVTPYPVMGIPTKAGAINPGNYMLPQIANTTTQQRLVFTQ